jgi:tritrans,polycis-undecaprenyl-diphosphate synthase [geranylgeranyl-diphosphate specific]
MMSMKTPSHLAIIPDGNRRCAKRLMKQPWKGHEWGAGKIRKMLDWCSEIGIRNVTVYALSLENLDKRPKEELGFLLALAKKEISDMIAPDGLAHKKGIRMTFFGSLERLPADLRETIREAREATKAYNGYTVNIAMAYGGRQELVDASRSIALRISQGKLAPGEVDEMVLRQSLQTNGSGDPDLIIRTGGEKRLSNFLLFQAAYAELAFTDTFWPDITKEEFMKIIKDYSARQRRFGQ